jgi:hypothetical protein
MAVGAVMHISAFPPEILQPIAKFLKAHDLIFTFERVCTSWAKSVDGDFKAFWRNVTIGHDFPLVEGEDRDYKADFKILCRTASICTKGMISKYLGTFVGDVPPISQKRFEWLCRKDFWDKDKYRYETYEWNVVPSHVRRTATPEVPFGLRGNTLAIIEDFKNIKEEELTIPLVLNNFDTLCHYPLSGGENGPIFNVVSTAIAFEGLPEEPVRNGVEIFFTRKDEVPLLHFEKCVQQGYKREKITALVVEALKNALHILSSGICPLSGNFYTCGRVQGNPDSFRLRYLGMFVPGTGLKFDKVRNKSMAGIHPCVSNY